MRLISNEESYLVNGGMSMIIAGPAAVVALVSQVDEWAQGWGFDFSSFINESECAYGGTGGGAVETSSENAAIELLNNIRKSIGFSANISGKISANSKGEWSVEVTFEIGGKYNTSGTNKK